MGDGEELTLKTIEVYRKWRDTGLPREKYLEMLAQLDGIYVPRCTIFLIKRMERSPISSRTRLRRCP